MKTRQKQTSPCTPVRSRTRVPHVFSLLAEHKKRKSLRILAKYWDLKSLSLFCHIHTSFHASSRLALQLANTYNVHGTAKGGISHVKLINMSPYFTSKLLKIYHLYTFK